MYGADLCFFMFFDMEFLMAAVKKTNKHFSHSMTFQKIYRKTKLDGF